MPFNQSGTHAAANISTYNDVAGSLTNTTDNSKKVGNITSQVTSGGVNAAGAGAIGSGTGTASGVSNSGNISF